MSYYSVEINYSLDGLSENEKNIKADKVGIEINQIAKETNGEFFAFDSDFGFSSSGMELLGVNYNWQYKDTKDIIKLLNELPQTYKIKWIYRYEKKMIDCVIYSDNTKSEIKKFTQSDTDLYRELLARIKLQK